MEIKVLGTGCTKCKSLEKNTKEAVKQLNIETEVLKVEDIVEIMNYGIMTTPALVVDGDVVVRGKVATIEEIKQILIKQ